MAQGLHGKRMAQHLGAINSSGLVLDQSSGRTLVLTHLRAPEGVDGPTKRITPEAAHVLSIHLQRPGLVDGWGTWTEGRYRPVTFWDLGGMELFDLRAEPSVLRSSSFECVHVYIPHATLQPHVEDAGLSAVPSLHTEPGKRDDVLLSWAKSLLPYFGERYLLPSLAVDELVSMFCSYLCKTYSDVREKRESTVGELAMWQKRRASSLIHERLAGELTLTELAAECRLSPNHFARAFKRSFGVPAHQYLINQRINMAKNLLLHGDLPLLSVALECGFADQSAFNRSFRAIVKTSPGAWQRDQRTMPVTVAWSTVSAAQPG
jgi:AraC family transcriptional regulator